MTRAPDCMADLLESRTLDALTDAFDIIEIECTRAWNGPEERELAREARQRLGEMLPALKALCWPLAATMAARLAANCDDEDDTPPLAAVAAAPQLQRMEAA